MSELLRHPEPALCDECGHPADAHRAHGCYCGCGAEDELPEPAPAPVPHEAPARLALLAFTHERLTPAQALALLHELEAAVGDPPQPVSTDGVWRRLDDFVLRRMTEVAAEQYLAFLSRRY